MILLALHILLFLWDIGNSSFVLVIPETEEEDTDYDINFFSIHDIKVREVELEGWVALQLAFFLKYSKYRVEEGWIGWCLSYFLHAWLEFYLQLCKVEWLESLVLNEYLLSYFWTLWLRLEPEPEKYKGKKTERKIGRKVKALPKGKHKFSCWGYPWKTQKGKR